jgi:exopolysaccharide biosynthesis predicted pyruvyltransferase EpsI
LNIENEELTMEEIVAYELDGIRKATVDVLSSIIPPGSTVALLDFPNHQNSGDSLIWLGELEYLRSIDVNIGYVADHSRYDPSLLRKRLPHGPILLSGGGNFGDRWGHMQDFRERVIGDFPDRPIIQLPQSIDFSSKERLAQAQSRFSIHPDLTILMRDKKGADKVRTLFPSQRVLFCPDMAFGYAPSPSSSRAHFDVLMLRRKDRESTGVLDSVKFGPGRSVCDEEWGLRRDRKLLWQALHTPGAIAKRAAGLSPVLHDLIFTSFNYQARINVANAVAILSRGRVVVTDRLHAAVLGALLGIPVVATNNANGKVAAIYEDYLHQMPNVVFATDANQVVDAVRSYLS